MNDHGILRLILAAIAILFVVSINYIIVLLPLNTPAQAIIITVFNFSFCLASVWGFREKGGL